MTIIQRGVNFSANLTLRYFNETQLTDDWAYLKILKPKIELRIGCLYQNMRIRFSGTFRQNI